MVTRSCTKRHELPGAYPEPGYAPAGADAAGGADGAIGMPGALGAPVLIFNEPTINQNRNMSIIVHYFFQFSYYWNYQL